MLDFVNASLIPRIINWQNKDVLEHTIVVGGKAVQVIIIIFFNIYLSFSSCPQPE